MDSIDWTSIINNTINQVPSWIAISQGQPIPAGGTIGGQQGVSFTTAPYGAGFTVSPGLIVAGVIAVVAVVYLARR
jgi:hypothetical protein